MLAVCTDMVMLRAFRIEDAGSKCFHCFGAFCDYSVSLPLPRDRNSSLIFDHSQWLR